MSSAFPLLRIGGVEVRAHWTWVFLLALMTVIFGGGLASQNVPRLDAVWAWGTGILIAVLVFVSVVVHELAHAGVARHDGIGGSVVVVQLLGGSYTMEIRPQNAAQELRTALAGPALSLGLAIGFTLIEAALGVVWGPPERAPLPVASGMAVVGVLAAFNAFIALINMLPGYPMDGARVVHAIAWAHSGRDDMANVISSRVGRFAGIAVILLGAVVVMVLDIWPGLALMFAGWLVIGSSRILDRRNFLQALVLGAKAVEAAARDLQRIPGQLTLDVYAPELTTQRPGDAALVERMGVVEGIVGMAQIRKVAQAKWGETRTEQVMVPLDQVPRVPADSEVWPAFEALERSGLDAIVIESAGPTAESTAPAEAAPPPMLMTRASAAAWIHDRAEQRLRVVAAARPPRGGLPFGRLPGSPRPPGDAGAPPDQQSGPPEPPAPPPGEPPAGEPPQDGAGGES